METERVIEVRKIQGKQAVTVEKKFLFKKKFLLAEVSTSRNRDDEFFVELSHQREHNYGPYYADEQEFNTEEEAFEHALKDERWHNKQFTILPVYKWEEDYSHKPGI